MKIYRIADFARWYGFPLTDVQRRLISRLERARRAPRGRALVFVHNPDGCFDALILKYVEYIQQRIQRRGICMLVEPRTLRCKSDRVFPNLRLIHTNGRRPYNTRGFGTAGPFTELVMLGCDRYYPRARKYRYFDTNLTGALPYLHGRCVCILSGDARYPSPFRTQARLRPRQPDSPWLLLDPLGDLPARYHADPCPAETLRVETLNPAPNVGTRRAASSRATLKTNNPADAPPHSPLKTAS